MTSNIVQEKEEIDDKTVTEREKKKKQTNLFLVLLNLVFFDWLKFFTNQ